MTMFDRYRLVLTGLAEHPYTLECELHFLDRITDTTNLDTIPIFVIDSLCIEGNCLSDTYCSPPRSYYESGRYTLKDSTRPLPDDLYWVEELHPGGYLLSYAYSIPETCEDRDVKVWVHSRLVDRITGLNLLSESKRIQFVIKKKKTIDFLD